MKVYVVHLGEFVKGVTTDREEAERWAREGLKYMNAGESEFRLESGDREALHFVSKRTNRWNRGSAMITTKELSTGTPAADLERSGRDAVE